MSAVERAGWMDNQATGIMREAIEKEAKWMQRGMKQLEDAGVIPRIEEEGEDAGASGRATGSRKVGLSTMDVERPRQLDRLAGDVELKRTTELSKTLWSSANASYLLRDGEALRSVAKSDYVWDSDELAYMKAQGEFDKKHCRRRDTFTGYVEAVAQHNNRMRAARDKGS